MNDDAQQEVSRPLVKNGLEFDINLQNKIDKDFRPFRSLINNFNIRYLSQIAPR